MDTLIDDPERSAHSLFHIVTLLQSLRRNAHDRFHRDPPWDGSRAETAEILAEILAVAIAARVEGFFGFTSVCMIVYERIEALLHRGLMPKAILGQLVEWSASAELYLRRPRHAEFAKALVLQLHHSAWGARLGRGQRDGLIRSLLECAS